jgi:hypothetical protein
MIVEAAIFGSVSSDSKGLRRHFLPLCSMGPRPKAFFPVANESSCLSGAGYEINEADSDA